MSDLHVILLGLVGPACLLVLGFFGRRIARRVDEAGEQRWTAVHDRLDEIRQSRAQMLAAIDAKLEELKAEFREEREDMRETLADLARVQGEHERWARQQLVHLTGRVGRIEGRLRLTPPPEAD